MFKFLKSLWGFTGHVTRVRSLLQWLGWWNAVMSTLAFLEAFAVARFGGLPVALQFVLALAALCALPIVVYVALWVAGRGIAPTEASKIPVDAHGKEYFRPLNPFWKRVIGSVATLAIGCLAVLLIGKLPIANPQSKVVAPAVPNMEALLREYNNALLGYDAKRPSSESGSVLLHNEGKIDKANISGNTVTGQQLQGSTAQPLLHLGPTSQIGTLDEKNNRVEFFPLGYLTPEHRRVMLDMWRGNLIDGIGASCSLEVCSVEQVRAKIKQAPAYDKSLKTYLSDSAVSAIFKGSADTYAVVLSTLAKEIDKVEKKWKIKYD